MTFTKLPKAITAEELLSTPLPPVKWIIPGLLPAGLALFAGPSKAGKSWLTLWLCLQIAQGNPVWNREIEPCTVIYFSLEDTFNRLQNRIFQLIDGGDAPERLILQTECPSIGQGLEEQVEALVHTYHDVGLIVIDTLQKVRLSDGNGGMYANDYKEAGALWDDWKHRIKLYFPFPASYTFSLCSKPTTHYFLQSYPDKPYGYLPKRQGQSCRAWHSRQTNPSYGCNHCCQILFQSLCQNRYREIPDPEQGLRQYHSLQ